MLTAITDLSQDKQLEAAELVRMSLEAYYERFGQPRRKLLEAMRELFAIPGSELGFGRALVGDRVDGIFCAKPIGELRRAQLIDLKVLVSGLERTARERVHEAIAAYGENVEAAPGSGLYLSRIAVRPERRGTGDADTLMRAFLDEAEAGEEAVLHVHRDNARAIRFYERYSFRPLSPESRHDYIVLTRAA